MPGFTQYLSAEENTGPGKSEISACLPVTWRLPCKLINIELTQILTPAQPGKILTECNIQVYPG
jgi:hypothetical protein